jgi:D-glycero-D-manno-heptose 1,7-bisphosphate phosphatase
MDQSESLQLHRTDGERVRAYTARATESAPSGALFFDRQAGLVRSICARSTPVNDFTVVRRSLDRMRDAGARIGVASHNRADGWETFDVGEISTMHGRMEAVLGPIDLWCVCLVDPGGSCACDGPAGGVLATGAEAAGVALDGCTVATDDGRLLAAAEQLGAATLLPLEDGTEEALARAVESVVR